jgi:radical SAM superfamily enzyme YgiQ (UPF0313 family)
MGMESGSNRILNMIKKDITVEQIEYAVRQCKKFNIMIQGFWIMGIPGESIPEVKKTLAFIWKLYSIYPAFFGFAPGIFRPYPGGEFYAECKKRGFDEPRSLREWSKISLYAGYLSAKSLPWIKKTQILQAFRFYGLLLNADSKGLFDRGWLRPVKLLVFLTKLRYKYGFWNLRLEVYLYNLFKRIVNLTTWKFTRYLKG